MCEKEHLIKLEKYCAYQERCHQEVRKKATELGVARTDIDEALLHLIQNNFLNEERYAILYARSKMNQKKWGPIKIEVELRKKQISARLISDSIGKIAKREFQQNLQHLTLKYIEMKNIGLNDFKALQKLRTHLATKGYPFQQINDVLNDLQT